LKEPKTIRELLGDPNWELEPELVARHMLMTINPADFVIMSTGALLGWNGYTPITALLKMILGIARSIPEVLTGAIDAARLNPINVGISGLQNFLQFFLPFKIFGSPLDPAALRANLVLEGIGLLESYAYTRPGFIPGVLQGIGSVGQAIGEIIPG